MEELQVNNVNMKIWDLSGQERMRSVWKHYYQSINGIVFVIDASDQNRLQESRDELHIILADKEIENVPILIFANKQDVEGSLGYAKIREELALCGENEKRPIRVQEASALKNEGLAEGFEWISQQINKA